MLISYVKIPILGQKLILLSNNILKADVVSGMI